MRINKQLGMTLIEILIVLAIIASLMAFLVPMVTSRLDKAKVQETKVMMGQVMTSLNLYKMDCGNFPESLTNLIQESADCPSWVPEPNMKNVPKDAWKNEFQYSRDGNQYVIISLGSDGREGGDGYGKDISSEDIQ